MWKTWFFFSLIYLICKTSALPKECKEDENGLKYEGTKSMSSSGGPCLSWKHQLVQRQFNTYNNSMLKENYCRNPDGHTSPWCFVEYLKIYRSVPFLPRGRIRESGFFGDRGPGFTLRQVKHIKKDPCDIPFCFEASFEWNGDNKTFGIQLSNSTKMINNNKTENNYILRIEPLLPNTSSIETSLKLPYLRPVSTGSCLQLEYRTKNLKLELKTASQTLTLLSESNEWKFVNVNIRPEAKEYQVSISSVSLPAFSKFAEVKYIRVREGSCQGCFPCFNDGLCVNKSGFCDVNIDCPDFSDERNCALECFFHNYYAGFRNETISFDPCTNGKCSFHKERYAKPGCVVENKWKLCNLDECERGNLTCTFVDNTCGWKPWKNGLKWSRKVNKNTGKAFVFPDKTIDVNWSSEDISILYSAPQPPSTEYSCLSISYSGRNSHIEAFITKGTMLSKERKVPVFQHLHIDSDDVKSTTFQTPIDTAFMVMIQANYTSKSDSVLKIHTIFQEIGICKDKDPCDLSQFQCIDGSCISSQKLCNNISNCPEDEDETFCKQKSFIIGVPIVHVCPAHCQCHDLIFKCSSIIDVTDEASANLKTQKCGTCAAITVWLFAVGIATAPLFFYSDFYSRSTVCISLPLTTDMFSGWEYSTLVFIVFNLLVFIAVVLGQILIFAEVKRIGSNVTNDTTKREIAVFKSLSYVVLSDAFCWIPIVLIGLLALGGVNISSDVYAWIVVVVLPINSALNPFIYTLSIMNKNKTKQCHSKST
uniref:Uncharacterized protein n=1 Tax=Magallana gigas TaxID=29159 RepID=A0A8W8KN41_MAGGI